MKKRSIFGQHIGDHTPTNWPLLVGLGGIVLTIVSYVVYGLHEANMMGISSASAFQEQTQLAGNAARSESYWNLLFVLPAEVLTIVALNLHFRRLKGAPRYFRKATSVGLFLVPLYVVTQALVRIAILAGMGRVDLSDPNHIVEPSTMIVDTVRYYSILPMWTYNIMTLMILAMGLTLLVRRFRRSGSKGENMLR